MRPSILLVEDDLDLGLAFESGLGLYGFNVELVHNGVAAERALNGQRYAACVLDLGLPDMDGIAVVQSIRSRSISTPILILTARDALSEKISGLNAGADDYVLKPVDLQELVARLKSLIRRSGGASSEVLTVGELCLNSSKRIVSVDGLVIELTAKEFDLVHLLMINEGRVVSKQKLRESLAKWGSEIESNSIEVHIHNIRRKLVGNHIETIRGIGYVINR
jgi:DNA-binding response OmpR family regulator